MKAPKFTKGIAPDGSQPDELIALHAMIDAFCAEQKKRLEQKFKEGKTGWDQPANAHKYQARLALLATGQADDLDPNYLIDIGNLAAFCWNLPSPTKKILWADKKVGDKIRITTASNSVYVLTMAEPDVEGRPKATIERVKAGTNIIQEKGTCILFHSGSRVGKGFCYGEELDKHHSSTPVISLEEMEPASAA